MKPLQSSSHSWPSPPLSPPPLSPTRKAHRLPGATALCKDGTYAITTAKSGACHGHQGVKEWFVTDSSANAPATSATGTTQNKAGHASAATMTQAPGGDPGMVWLNSDTNVYHCPGTRYYGKTKQGSYISEADAKAKGAHPNHNHPCTK